MGGKSGGGTIGAVIGAIIGVVITVATAGAGAPIGAWMIAKGAMIGASIGSAIGTAIDPPDAPSLGYGTLGDYGSSAVYGRSGALTSSLSNRPPVPIVYGRMRLAGNIVWWSDPDPSDTTDTYKQIIVLAQGEVNSITDIRINDNSIDDYTSDEVVVRSYLGTKTQTKDAIVGDAEGLNLRGFAYLAVEIKNGEKVPYGSTFTAIVEGRKVLCPDVKELPVTYVNDFANGSIDAGFSIGSETGTCIRNAQEATYIEDRGYNSLHFDGDVDYVNCGNKSIFDFTQATGFSIYLELRCTGDTGSYQGIIGKYNSGQNKGYDLTISSSGKPRFTVRGSSNIDTGEVGSIDYRDSIMHKWLITADGSNTYVYIDGIEIKHTTGTWTAVIADNILAIGTRGNDLTTNFLGEIKNVSIYNRVITSVEHTALQNGIVPSTSLVANWKLNDSTGVTAIDSSTNGNDGTLIGCEWLLSTDAVMKTVTTANQPRFPKYSYNETGLVDTAGVYEELSATNYLIYSKDFSNGNWVKSITSIDADSMISPDGIQNADKLIFTTSTSSYVRQVVSGENPASSTYTFSIWLKADSARDIRLRIDSTTGGTITTKSLDTTWRRFSISRTFDETEIADIEANIFNSDPNSVVPVYAWGAQLEKGSHATSFIPTTTTAITRGAEVLKYDTIGNRSAGAESCIIKCYPNYNSTNHGYMYLLTADTKTRDIYFNDSNNDVRIRPNNTDSLSCAVEDVINTSWSAFDKMTIGYNVQHESPFVAGFYQGVTSGTNETSDDFIDNVYGTSFYIGSKANGQNQFSGIISSVAFCNRTLTNAEHLWINNNDWTSEELITYLSAGSDSVSWADYVYDDTNEYFIKKTDSSRLYWDGSSTRSEYSENPSAILKDFLINYLNKETDAIIDSSFYEAYKECEVAVTDGEGGTEERYRLNYTLDSKRPALDYLADMLFVMRGNLLYEGNKIKLKIDKKRDVVHSFGDGSTLDVNNYNNIGENSFRWALGGLDDYPNQIIVHWIDPDQKYNDVTVEYNDRINQEERGDKVIKKEFAMYGIQYQAQASRMAKRLYHETKYNAVKCSWTGFPDAKDLELGDVVDLWFKGALYEGKKFRLTEITVLADELLGFTATEYNEYIFDDNLGSVIYTQNGATGINIFAPLSDVSSVVIVEYGTQNKDGKHIANIDVTWEAISIAERIRLDHYQIEYSTDGSTWLGQYWSGSDTTTFRIPDVKDYDGQEYLVRIKTISSEGIYSSGTLSNTLIMTGKDDPPPDVAGFSVNYNSGNKELVFTWTQITGIPDLEGYEIRTGGSTWETSAVVDTFLTGTSYRTNNFTAGVKSYFIKAIDYSGGYSENASEDVITLTGIPEDNVIIRLDEWERLIVGRGHPSEGILSDEMRIDMTTDYDVNYYRNALTPKTDYDWSELDALALTCDQAEAQALQMDKFVTNAVTYTTTFFEIADTDVLGVLKLAYRSASEGGGTSITIEYATSSDNVDYSEWKTFSVAELTTRYIKFRITLQTTNEEYYIRMSSFRVLYDVPDITDEGSNVTVAVGGTTISFNVEYSIIPRTVIATVVGASGSRTPIIDNVTKVSFDCIIYDKDDASIEENINWFSLGAGGRS